MATAKNKSNEAMPLNYKDLSDTEFIAYADYLSSPYYKAYVEAKNQSSTMSSANDNKTTKQINGYRRRKGFLALIVIFMLIVIAIAGLGYLGNIIPEYISAFNKLDGGGDIIYISVTDPIMGALKKFAILDVDSYFYDDCLAGVDSQTNIGLKIAAYGMPIVIALYMLLALIIFLVALVALCKKSVSKGYVAKKAKFGYISLLLFLFSLFVTTCAIVWNGKGLSDITKFFTASSTNINAGYGLLAMVGLSFLTMVFNWCSYKKAK